MIDYDVIQLYITLSTPMREVDSLSRLRGQDPTSHPRARSLDRDSIPVATLFPEEAPTSEQRDAASEIVGLISWFIDPPEGYERIPLARKNLEDSFKFMSRRRQEIGAGSQPITWVHVLGAAKRQRYLLQELRRLHGTEVSDFAMEVAWQVEGAAAAMADEVENAEGTDA